MAIDLELAPKRKRPAGEPCCEPVVYPDVEREHASRMAEVAKALGDTDLAASWFERAAEADEGVGAAPWAAHARREQGAMLLAAGETTAAEELLDRAATTYRELRMDAWARRCAVAVA